MTVEQTRQFIERNKNSIPTDDAYYIQWQRAIAIYDRQIESIETGYGNPVTDQLIVTIGNECLSVGLFNAEAIDALASCLYAIMDNAIDELKAAYDIQ